MCVKFSVIFQSALIGFITMISRFPTRDLKVDCSSLMVHQMGIFFILTVRVTFFCCTLNNEITRRLAYKQICSGILNSWSLITVSSFPSTFSWWWSNEVFVWFQGKASGERAALWVRAGLQSQLFQLGCFLHKHAGKVLFVAILVMATFCVGLKSAQLHSRVDQLWVQGKRSQLFVHFVRPRRSVDTRRRTHFIRKPAFLAPINVLAFKLISESTSDFDFVRIDQSNFAD